MQKYRVLICFFIMSSCTAMHAKQDLSASKKNCENNKQKDSEAALKKLKFALEDADFLVDVGSLPSVTGYQEEVLVGCLTACSVGLKKKKKGLLKNFSITSMVSAIRDRVLTIACVAAAAVLGAYCTHKIKNYLSDESKKIRFVVEMGDDQKSVKILREDTTPSIPLISY